MQITYHTEPDLAAEQFIDVLRRSGFDARRPVDDLPRIKRMLANANLVVCARDGGKLVGVARAITDFSYCCYLSDLAVDREYQRRGIGKELIAQVDRACGEDAMLLLLAAPAARDYYGHIGMQKADNAWIIPRKR